MGWLWWNGWGGMIVVEGLWWNDCGGMVVVEGLWWNDCGGMVMTSNYSERSYE